MVYVISASGKPLMPTKRYGRVRHLLDRGEARVVRRTPFTIQLNYETEDRTQPITLGVDAGSKTVGISATTEKAEVFAAELTPRNDVTKLLSKRREHRRARRNRTTRHRKPRFENRVHSKHKGWLAPSVEVKIQNHIQGIKLATQILPVTTIVVETGEFDLQRLKAMEEGRPLPVGADYQLGEMYSEYNVRQYIFHRDGYRCRKCGAHGDGIKFHAHHLESRLTGSNRPANLITLCESCHKKYHAGAITLDGIKKGRNYRDAAFMGIMRPTLMLRLHAEFPDIEIKETKGYITKLTREKNFIPKSHINDARCISGHPKAAANSETFLLKPVRAHNRKLHKETILKGGYRKNNQAPREVFGFRLFDKVLLNGKEGFVFGRRNSGSFDVRTLAGGRLSTGVSYKKLTLLEKSKNLLIERMQGCSSPCLKAGASAAENFDELTVRVLDTNGAPVAGATVNYGGADSGSVTTDENGEAVVMLPGGQYNLQAVMGNRTSPETTINLAKNADVILTIGALGLADEPPVVEAHDMTIDGNVVAPDGTPVEGVVVIKKQ